MKKTRIITGLFLLLGLFFVNLSKGQGLNTWPSTSGAAVKSDTLYICANIDDIHPIELGYDIPGLRLHPSYGVWSLYAISDYASPNDYAVGNAKNGGSGNAFKVVGSGIGGYIFQYEANSEQCGLDVGETYHMYVFIIPSLESRIAADTVLCKQAKGNTISSTINNYFPHVELYQKANINVAWTPSQFPAVKVDSVGTVIYSADLTLTGPTGALSCGTTGKFDFTVNVTEADFTLTPITVNICEADTVGVLANRDPKVYFGRNVAGSYSPSTIGNNWGAASQQYVFTYTDCMGNPKTVTDVLKMGAAPASNNWGSDTLILCRNQIAREADLYNLTTGVTPISLLPTNSSWADRGITGTLPLVHGPSGSSVFLDPSSVNTADMGANIGYNFMYRIDPSLCFGGDSGLFVLMLQDPFTAVDFRTQLCTDYFGSNFDLAAFTGIKDGSWSYVGAMASQVNSIANSTLTGTQLNTMGNGTHKLQYTVPAGCGGGGTGVMYIKIGGKVSIPASITEKFCKKTLPSVLNVNEIIGFSGIASGSTNKWELTEISNGGTAVDATALAAAQTYFEAALGTFDLTKATGNAATKINIGAATTGSPLKLTFSLTGASCSAGGGASVLTIEIVDDVIM